MSPLTLLITCWRSDLMSSEEKEEEYTASDDDEYSLWVESINLILHSYKYLLKHILLFMLKWKAELFSGVYFVVSVNPVIAVAGWLKTDFLSCCFSFLGGRVGNPLHPVTPSRVFSQKITTLILKNSLFSGQLLLTFKCWCMYEHVVQSQHMHNRGG